MSRAKPSRNSQDKERIRHVGRSIAEARKARRLSQAALARAVGRSQNLIYTIECGESDPGVVLTMRIAEVLDVPLALLLPH